MFFNHLFKNNTNDKENTITINISVFAVLVSDDSTAVYIAIGIVWVFPGIFPHTISVAPNSPRALANERINPPKRPGNARGSVIEKNVFILDAPRFIAVFSYNGSIDKNADLAFWYISGIETITLAITPAIHVNTKLLPVSSIKIFPINPFLPITINNKYPKTEGGKTIGRIIIESKKSFPLKSYFVNILAKIIPRITVKMLEILAIFREINIGSNIIFYFITTNPFFSNLFAFSFM